MFYQQPCHDFLTRRGIWKPKYQYSVKAPPDRPIEQFWVIGGGNEQTVSRPALQFREKDIDDSL